jgi:hypothetical protein
MKLQLLGRACHDRGLGELRTEIAVRSELAEESFAEGFGVFLCRWIWLFDLGATALGGRASHLHWFVLGKAEGNIEGRIVYVDVDLLVARIDRRLQQQSEMKGEYIAVVI